MPAQTLNSGSILSWSDCVSLASKNNPSLASSGYSLQASRASYSGSYNGIYPQINLFHSYSNTSNAVTGNGTNWQTGGSASLNLFNQSQISNIKTSQALLAQSEANLRQVSSTLRYNLLTVFYQVLFSQKSIEVSQNILKLRENDSQLVALRYDSGTEYKGDMLRAKAQLLQAKADLAQAIRNLRTAQRALNQQLGLDDFTVLSVTSTLNIQEPGDMPKDEGSLLKSRPDVALEEAVVESAQASLSQAKSTLWPTLSANYSLASDGENEFSTGSPESQLGLSLSYPIFGQGVTATYFAVKTAKNNLEKARQDLRSTINQAVLDIETNWSNFMGAIDQAKVQAALLAAARTRNDEADIRYESGLLTYDSWEIIASDRINQERQAIQAQLNVMTAQAAWENSLGKLLNE